MNTSNVLPKLRPYLLLLLELLMESPIRRNGVLIPYEKVVAALESDTVSSGVKLGLETTSRFSCGPFSHTASLMLQIEPKKYVTGVNWMVDLLKNTEFVIERIRVCAAKMANDVAQAKRSGDSVGKELLKAMYYVTDSNVQQSSMLRQHKFLTGVLERLEKTETAKSVINDLNELRNNITAPVNLAVHVAADWEKMSKMDIDLNKPWGGIVGNETSVSEW